LSRLFQGYRLRLGDRHINDSWLLHVADYKDSFDVQAGFVVDATGRACSLARRLGSVRFAYDRLVGVVGFFTDTSTSVNIEEFTLIEAVENGWWYSAPLPSGGVVVAYMTDADLHANTRLPNLSYWKANLQHAPQTNARIASLELDSKTLRVVCANSSYIHPICCSGWLAVGDAATAYDPLSGDGVLRSLNRGVQAAKVILSKFSGNNSTLEIYSQELSEEFNFYLQKRNAYYSREKRWLKSPFWTRRQIGSISNY
jgi:flavin-dependent dehydrogenase